MYQVSSINTMYVLRTYLLHLLGRLCGTHSMRCDPRRWDEDDDDIQQCICKWIAIAMEEGKITLWQNCEDDGDDNRKPEEKNKNITKLIAT